MGFELSKFAALRPYLYHLTARSNAPLIAEAGAIHAAARYLEGREELSLKRKGHLRVRTERGEVHLRDQDPLHAGNIELGDGMTFGDFVAHLNRHVFFWPGDADGPISYGERHFARYQHEAPVILRMRAVDLFAANTDATPQFCPYNSGSPRCSGGKRSPRGRATFAPADTATFPPGKVIEVVFRDLARLPEGVEWMA